MAADPMSWLQWAEALSYIVTVFGLPMAILVFMHEQRRQRQGEEEELYRRLDVGTYSAFVTNIGGSVTSSNATHGPPAGSSHAGRALDPDRRR
jgi:hypothetical protein